MKALTRIILLVSGFVLLYTGLAFCAPPPPPPPCGTPPCPTNIPIDGGISLLVAAGVAYGSKKIYESRKKN